MHCPCGSQPIQPAHFRDWLDSSQEARMHARSVLKSTDPLLSARAASVDGRPALILGELGTPAPDPEPERTGLLKRMARIFSASAADRSAQGASRVRSPARIGNAE